MSATVLVSSGSVQREPTIETDTSTSQTTASPTPQDLASLAYALWEQRGCPFGSPEADWLEAEKQLRK